MIWINILLFLVGLLALVKGGDWFVDGAVGISKRFRLPPLVIGATIVSIGTTLPEVMVSVQGAASGAGGIAYGNSIGSIICNTALIAALSIALEPSHVSRRSLALPVTFFFSSAAVYAFCAYFFGEFSRVAGIVLLAIFLLYVAITLIMAKKDSGKNETDEETQPTPSDEVKIKTSSFALEILLIVIGAALIAVGADLLVDNGTAIAKHFGMPDTVIALTFVALGTSLPELVTAITALVKKQSSLSLGNIIGANIFNLVLVSGTAITISPFSVPSENLIGTVPSSLVIEIPLMLAVMCILTIPALIKGKLYRWQGFLLIGIYLVFCVSQFLL
jgi:cation:H+ antiporter